MQGTQKKAAADAATFDIQLPGQWAGYFSEDRPLGWDPVAAGNRAGDGMACNDGDRRQWRKQGAIVGAAASKTQAVAKRMLGAATRTRVRGESFRRTDLPRTFLQKNARLSRINSQRDTAGRKKSLSVHVSVIQYGYTTDRGTCGWESAGGRDGCAQ